MRACGGVATTEIRELISAGVNCARESRSKRSAASVIGWHLPVGGVSRILGGRVRRGRRGSGRCRAKAQLVSHLLFAGELPVVFAPVLAFLRQFIGVGGQTGLLADLLGVRVLERINRGE